MHEYNAKDISSCLESRKIVFAGDSTIRQIFWATARKLDARGADAAQHDAEKHEDLTFCRAGVTINFIWDPFLNTSVLHQHLAAHRDAQDQKLRHKNEVGKSAAITLIGGGLWYAQHFGTHSLEHFKESLDTVTWLTNHGEHGDSSQQIEPSFPHRPKPDALLVYAPAQVPWYESLSPPHGATLTAGNINPLNEYLQEISIQRGVLVAWSYILMTLTRKSAYEDDGLHVIDTVARRKADVLLNLRCNAELTRKTKYPMDKTCCSDYPRANWVQKIVLFGSMCTLPFMVWITSGGM